MEKKPATATRLCVSIVTHNSAQEMVERTLQTLYQSAVAAHAANSVNCVQVSILDNSPDPVVRQTLAECLAAWPETDFFKIEFIGLPENRGFGAGHNVAIQQQDSDFHLVLNPDVELAEDALLNGVDCLRQDQGIVLLSPRVEGADGMQEFLCKRYPSLLVLMLRAFAPSALRRFFQQRLNHYEMRDVCSGSEQAEVPLASGCFMLMRSAALRAIGGFNENYFLYFEDFDLSIRLRKEGRLVFNPAIQILHHGGYAAKKGRLHRNLFLRSGFAFFREHGWRWI